MEHKKEQKSIMDLDFWIPQPKFPRVTLSEPFDAHTHSVLHCKRETQSTENSF